MDVSLGYSLCDWVGWRETYDTRRTFFFSNLLIKFKMDKLNAVHMLNFHSLSFDGVFSEMRIEQWKEITF